MSVQSNIESGATEKVWELQQPVRSGNAVWEEGRVRVRDHDGQNFGVMFLTEYTDEAGPNDWEMGYFAVDDVSYSFSAACDLLPTDALPRGGGSTVQSLTFFLVIRDPPITIQSLIAISPAAIASGSPTAEMQVSSSNGRRRSSPRRLGRRVRPWTLTAETAGTRLSR